MRFSVDSPSVSLSRPWFPIVPADFSTVSGVSKGTNLCIVLHFGFIPSGETHCNPLVAYVSTVSAVHTEVRCPSVYLWKPLCLLGVPYLGEQRGERVSEGTMRYPRKSLDQKPVGLDRGSPLYVALPWS